MSALNPYSIILSLFILLGLAASVWGWLIISRSRKTLQWPKVQGKITDSSAKSAQDDLLPHIAYSYTVEGHELQGELAFPADMTPTQELAAQYAEKYPAGKIVDVHFDPTQPQHSTIEPGLAQGDWLVFAMGLGSTVIGLLLIIFH